MVRNVEASNAEGYDVKEQPCIRFPTCREGMLKEKASDSRRLARPFPPNADDKTGSANPNSGSLLPPDEGTFIMLELEPLLL